MSTQPLPPIKNSERPAALRLTVDADAEGLARHRAPAPRPRRRLLAAAGLALALLAPSAIAAWYLYAVASDVYVTQASFAVRRAGDNQVSLPISFLNSSFNSGRAADESYAVVEFIRSREAMRLLDGAYGLRAKWQAASVDWLNRLATDADAEALFDAYGSRVHAYYDEVSGLLTLETEAFDPDTAFAMAVSLREASEALVNRFNDRAAQDLLSLTGLQVRQAEEKLVAALEAMTRFRVEHQSIDPAAVTAMLDSIITSLQQEAALTKAEIREIGGIAAKDTPRMRELRNRLAAIEGQIAAEQARLTGGSDEAAVVRMLDEYERLTLSGELARQGVVAAYGAHETALTNLQRQQLYVVSVVPPALEREPKLPDRPRLLLYVAFGSLVLLIVARLSYAAIRDHAL